MMSNILYLYYNKATIVLSKYFRYHGTFFRIRKISNSSKDTFYNIEEIFSHSKLSILGNKKLVFEMKKNILQFWNFIKIKDNIFALKNKNNCYIKINHTKIYCSFIPLNQAAKFKIIRIYSEVSEKHNSNDIKILNQEPIDILMKYIDLRDPNLNRKGLNQIEKDYENEEIRYSVRSICKNIPWIRKIFILMPNEKVRYFKEYNLIKKKIVYIKDKDLLGYDSSNPRAFQFRYWKMKKYGISDNIIVMDDDYFIGKTLEKSDFFHIKNGKVVPSIITSDFLKIDKKFIQKNLLLYESKTRLSNEEQNSDIFNYCRYLTLSFILNTFNISDNKTIFVPQFTHNAIPVNLKEIKEMYDLIYKSKYKYTTLDCLYRHMNGLQFEVFVLSYTFMKYDRQIKNISYNYIPLNNSVFGNYNYSLFCINKGAGCYSNLTLYQAKNVMEYLFPNPSPYEIDDTFLFNLTFNDVYSMIQTIKSNENIISHMITKKECLYIIINLILIFIVITIKLNK